MLEASNSFCSTRLAASQAYRSYTWNTTWNLKPARRALKARTTPGSLHAETICVAIRVRTSWIIRRVPEQRQTVAASRAPLGSIW